MTLGLGERFTLQELIVAVEDYYGCKVKLVPFSDMPLPHTATAFVVPGVYIVIFYRDDVPASHAQQLICHEFVHVLCNHQSYECQELAAELVAELAMYVPDGYQAAACRVCICLVPLSRPRNGQN